MATKQDENFGAVLIQTQQQDKKMTVKEFLLDGVFGMLGAGSCAVYDRDSGKRVCLVGDYRGFENLGEFVWIVFDEGLFDAYQDELLDYLFGSEIRQCNIDGGCIRLYIDPFKEW